MCSSDLARWIDEETLDRACQQARIVGGGGQLTAATVVE